MRHWNCKNKPLQIIGTLFWLYIRHCTQLEFYMLKLPPSSDLTAAIGVNSFLTRFCNPTACEDILAAPSYPWPQQNSMLRLFFSIIRTISLFDTDSRFVCSHLPNSKNSSLILRSLATVYYGGFLPHLPRNARHCFLHKVIVFIIRFKIYWFLELWISRAASKLYGIVAVGFWNLCIKPSVSLY